MFLGSGAFFRAVGGAVFAGTVGQRGRFHYLLRGDNTQIVQTSDRISYKESPQMGRQRHGSPQVSPYNDYVSPGIHGGVHFNYTQLFERELQLIERRGYSRRGTLPSL